MNRKQLKKRLKALSIYLENINKKCELANHLLNETVSRKKTLEEQINENKSKLTSMKAHLDVGKKSHGLLANVYGCIVSLESIKTELEEQMEIILFEYNRRFSEFKKLKVKSLGVENLIDKTKNEISALDMKDESAMIESWVSSRLIAKTK